MQRPTGMITPAGLASTWIYSLILRYVLLLCTLIFCSKKYDYWQNKFYSLKIRLMHMESAKFNVNQIFFVLLRAIDNLIDIRCYTGLLFLMYSWFNYFTNLEQRDERSVVGMMIQIWILYIYRTIFYAMFHYIINVHVYVIQQEYDCNDNMDSLSSQCSLMGSFKFHDFFTKLYTVSLLWLCGIKLIEVWWLLRHIVTVFFITYRVSGRCNISGSVPVCLFALCRLNRWIHGPKIWRTH